LPARKDIGRNRTKFHRGKNNKPNAAVEELGQTNTSKCMYKSNRKITIAAQSAP
jgi:hypothetical protein